MVNYIKIIHFILTNTTSKGMKRGNEKRWCLCSRIVFGFDNMTHEDGVASIGDDEKEEWMVHVETWRHAAQNDLTARCGRSLSSFFVNLKRKGSLYHLRHN